MESFASWRLKRKSTRLERGEGEKKREKGKGRGMGKGRGEESFTPPAVKNSAAFFTMDPK